MAVPLLEAHHHHMTTTHSATRAPAFVVDPQSGRRYGSPAPEVPLPGVEIKLDGRQGAPFSVMVYDVPAHFAPPPVLHRHTREFGVVYVLDGALTYWFEDGVEHLALPGALVVMGTSWFRWANATDQAAKILCIFCPAGFEQFFADIHESMNALGYDMSRFGDILTRLRTQYGDEAYPNG